jgi:hypothetical protein
MSRTKRGVHKKDGLLSVAFWQFMAFLLLILTIWLNEQMDFSAMWFGTAPQKANLFRGFVLTAAVLVVSVVTVGHTYVQQKRIISGLLTVCARCRMIRVDDELWKHMDEYVSEHSLALISHGLCPGCFAAMQDEIKTMAKSHGKTGNPG